MSHLKKNLLLRTLAVVAILIVVFAVIVILGVQPAGTADQSKDSVKFVSADRGTVSTVVTATGQLKPLVTVQVGSQVSGNIQFLKADFNSRVTQGNVIAQIEPSLFLARRAQALASVQSAEAALDKSVVTLRDAKRQLERMKNLRKREMVSDSELDAVQLVFDGAQVETKVQQASVAEARAALQLAEVDLKHTTILAPISGIVISRDVDVGQTVAASLQAPTLFTIAQDLAKMQIEADIDEAFIGMVREGQPVRFFVYAFPDREFHGTLVQTRLNPESEKDVVIYKSIVDVDNSDLSLKPGMTATLSILIEERHDVNRVPTESLHFVPALTGEEMEALRFELKLNPNEAILWVNSASGLRPIKVSVGLRGENYTEVSGAKLEEGMQVAVPGSRKSRRAKRKWGLQLF